jgi:ATP-binding cassette subfamily F protein 2
LDTTLELSYGARYGLIGSNGSGKSQFLQSLAHREVPIPEHIDIFLLDHEAEPSDRTALQCVIDDAQAEVKRLELEADRILEEQGPESEVLEALYARLDALNPVCQEYPPFCNYFTFNPMRFFRLLLRHRPAKFCTVLALTRP